MGNLEESLEEKAEREGLKLKVKFRDEFLDPGLSYKNYPAYFVESDFGLPKTLVDELKEGELYGVWYHDLGRVKLLFRRVIVILAMLGLTFIFLDRIIGNFFPNLLSLWRPLVSIAMGVGFPILMVRYLEFKADEFASSKVGSETMINALKKTGQFLGDTSTVGPTIRERINNIRRK